jgi:hypothetical protein
MLEALPRVNIRQLVLRLANLTHTAAFAGKKGLTIDEITDVIAFVRDDLTKELMEGPFERKTFFGGRFGPVSRFSDGTWPVFYTANDQPTATAEDY